jgi:hypothetical protein
MSDGSGSDRDSGRDDDNEDDYDENSQVTRSLPDSLQQSGVTHAPRRRKDELDLEDTGDAYFKIPRKNCHQIAPELVRVSKLQKRSQQKARYRIMQKMLKKGRIDNVLEHMKHVMDLDESEKLYKFHHGEVSKQIYESIFNDRDFDLYGRLMPRGELTWKEDVKIHRLAEEMGIEYTSKREVDETPPVDIFEDITASLKAPLIMTEKWAIGFEPKYNPPIGFKQNKEQPLKSYGNEAFFSYRGMWGKGKMNGAGLYKYRDEGTYEGEYKDNRPHGMGHSKYTCGTEYRGEWVGGKYGGEGIQKMREQSSYYRGEFKFGRRDGKGKLEYACGLVYIGDFLDGKPHGRGKMTSKLSGYSWEGSFKHGSIEGSGSLVTPAPDYKRIVQYWKPTEGAEERTLATIVRAHQREKEDRLLMERQRKDELYGPLRASLLDEYVATIRRDIHETRATEKKQRQIEKLQEMNERKAEIAKARLKGLTGEA